MNDNYFNENMGWMNPNMKSKWWISFSTLIISMIATAILAFLIAAKRDDILWMFGIDRDVDIYGTETDFSIWDEVELTGIIASDGDMTNYTHTINTQYGLFGLKSSKIDLNNYRWEVQFEWFIEKFHQWVPIVSVSSIYELEFEEEILEDTWEKQAKYLPKIWVYFNEKFFEKYALINEWDWKSFKVKELDSNQIIEVQYFKCDNNSLNENCNKLSQNIWWAASQKFVDSYGNTYYKQPEWESWFFTNWLYGYFIHNMQDSYVKNLSKNLILINKKYAQDHISKNVSKLCSDGTNHISSIEKSEVKLQNSKIMYVVDGKDWESIEINCELEIDPTVSDYARLSKIDVKWGDDTTQEDDAQEDMQQESDDSYQKDDSAVALDPSVKQFPLKPEWWLVYTSARGWYSMQFPSANIAYEASVSSEDMWNGLKCPYVINVIKYADKDNLKDSPTVQVYECSWDPSATSWAPWIVVYSKANKVFVAKVNDSAWFDFANNLNITEVAQ